MSKPKRIYPGDGDPRHGTFNGYNNLGCHCRDCAVATSRYRASRALGSAPLGHLMVSCWCEEEFVFVSAADVRNGRTGSCRRPGCRETAMAS